MTPAQLKHRLLRLLHVEQPGSAPAYVQDDVTQAINTAYQILWTAVPQDRRSHYTRRADTVTLASGDTSALMAEDVAGILGPIRRQADKKQLLPLTHESEYLNWTHLAGSGSGSADGKPRAYWIQRTFQAADDATQIRIFVAPTPTASTTLEIPVEMQAPRFETADFCADPQPTLRIPHAYIESLLLPVALYYASASAWFTKTDMLPRIESDAQRALAQIGVTDPILKSTAPAS